MRKRKNRGRNIQRERRISHGDYLTVHIFPVFQKPGKRRKKSKPTSEIQKRLNQKHREERLTWLIDENFKPGDLEVGAGYRDDTLPDTYEEVQRDVRNFIRRVKRYRELKGLPEMKYIYTIEKGAQNGRWHIHIITQGDINRDELEKLWGKGYAHAMRLDFDDEGMIGLAKYKIKEPETEIASIKGKVHRWSASKNLKKPVTLPDRDGFISKETTKDIREGNISEREIERLYPGYTITSWDPWHNDINAGEYLTIRLRRTKVSRERKEIFKQCRKRE